MWSLLVAVAVDANHATFQPPDMLMAGSFVNVRDGQVFQQRMRDFESRWIERRLQSGLGSELRGTVDVA